MGPSSNNRSRSFVVVLDRVVLGGIALGLGLYVMPFWKEGRLLWAFWLTFICTLLHIYTSRQRGLREGDP